jgi:hypothetical protein
MLNYVVLFSKRVNSATEDVVTNGACIPTAMKCNKHYVLPVHYTEQNWAQRHSGLAVKCKSSSYLGLKMILE